MTIKAILLDLDDTLYEYNPVHQIALMTAFEKISNDKNIDIEVVKIEFNLAKKRLKSMLPNVASNHSRILYFQLLMEKLKIMPITYAYDISYLYWNTFLKHMTLTSDSNRFLERYSHMPICLVTDLTAEIQYRKLTKLQLENSIDYIVTSEEAGVEKPHPFIFKRALTKLGLLPEEVVMIGDNYDKDIVGAHLLGIKSYWINRNQESSEKNIYKCCTQVYSLDEIIL
jgi:putative hydrolase of the HAD superfamily